MERVPRLVRLEIAKQNRKVSTSDQSSEESDPLNDILGNLRTDSESVVKSFAESKKERQSAVLSISEPVLIPGADPLIIVFDHHVLGFDRATELGIKSSSDRLFIPKYGSPEIRSPFLRGIHRSLEERRRQRPVSLRDAVDYYELLFILMERQGLESSISREELAKLGETKLSLRSEDLLQSVLRSARERRKPTDSSPKLP